ncbi:MAG: tRNA epoxyqueuosine(34) reductase QueG [Candidatus Neomarinimicrobiota bacterium]
MNSSLADAIKSRILESGFQKVGIARAGPDESSKINLENWLAFGNHASMGWIENRKIERGNILEYFPEAKSVVSVGLNYFTGFDQSHLSSDLHLSNYAWGDDYHNIFKDKLFKILSWLKSEIEPLKGLVCVDTAPVMEKVWAQKAGLGWQGKHTNLITRDYGSWLFLGELILDIELKYDHAFREDLCGTCTACITACPTQALTPNKLDAGKCLSYLTIEHRGPLPENQNNLKGWIYGCDICQEVCPWNQKFSQKSKNNAFLPRAEILNKKNQDWSSISRDEFSKLFKGSAVKRTKYEGLKRNIENCLNKGESHA